MTTNDLTPTPGQTIGPFFGYFNKTLDRKSVV